MANFVGIIDPDPVRRAAFISSAASSVAPFPGLAQGELGLGNLAVAWAAGRRAPVSRHEGPDGRAILFGDAIPGPGPERLTAAGLWRDWLGPDITELPSYDGYHVGIACSLRGEVRVGCDILGMFPLYWWQDGDVILFGSSIALFALHPRFDTRVDPRGLAGILTLNGMVVNRPLYRGVRRLAAGRVLGVGPGGRVSELPQYQIPDSTAYHDLAFSTVVDLLDETLAGVIARLTPPGPPVGQLLSGGLDSRLLAGLLHRQGSDVVALTLGIPRDLEARCATSVARTLGFRHLLRNDLAADSVTAARRYARWEHLSAGFFSPMGWATPSLLEELPDRTVAGYAFDFLVSPKNPGLKPGQDADGLFDATLERTRRWGLPEAAIGELLGDDQVVPSVLAELRQEFLARSPRAVRARAKHHMANRARFHLGSSAWRMSFVTWPVFPVLDRALQSLVAGVPVSCLAERRAQQELIRTRFPGLARLPLDRNSYDTRPLDPPTLFMVREALARRTRRLLAPLHRLRAPRERRYYYRTADFNRPAWTAIRRAADEARAAAATHVDRTVLDRILPRADVKVEVGNPIIQSNGYRLLTGLILWSEDAASHRRAS